MALIPVSMAHALTTWSQRTFFRRIADGTLKQVSSGPRSFVDSTTLAPHACIPFDVGTLPIIEKACASEAEAQNDLGMICLELGQEKNAVFWFTAACEQNYADAAHWLARCYLGGWGVEPAADTGLMYLAKASSLGHTISNSQLGTLATIHSAY